MSKGINMRFHQLLTIFQLILIGLIVLIVLLWAMPTSDSAIAAIVQVENASKQTLYRSQQRLGDRSGAIWQVIIAIDPDIPLSVVQEWQEVIDR
jgi:hypothetical protein